jgi:hypothetical protein
MESLREDADSVRPVVCISVDVMVLIDSNACGRIHIQFREEVSTNDWWQSLLELESVDQYYSSQSIRPCLSSFFFVYPFVVLVLPVTPPLFLTCRHAVVNKIAALLKQCHNHAAAAPHPLLSQQQITIFNTEG